MVKSFAKPLLHLILEKAMCQNFCAIIHQLIAITFEKTACKVLVWKLITITFHRELSKKNCLQNIALKKDAWEFCSHVPMFMDAWSSKVLQRCQTENEEIKPIFQINGRRLVQFSSSQG